MARRVPFIFPVIDGPNVGNGASKLSNGPIAPVAPVVCMYAVSSRIKPEDQPALPLSRRTEKRTVRSTYRRQTRSSSLGYPTIGAKVACDNVTRTWIFSTIDIVKGKNNLGGI